MSRRFKFGKLVRDKIAQHLQHNGGRVAWHSLAATTKLEHLKYKLLEETEEIFSASSPQEAAEELGDVLEILYTIAKIHNLQIIDIENARLQKHKKLGGFEDGVFIDFVDVDTTEDSHPIVQFCLSRPHKYPEILEG